MIGTRFKPYPETKDTGIKWLGQIPEHWNVRRLKDHGMLVGGAGFPHEYQGVVGEDLQFYKVGDLRSSSDGHKMHESSNSVSRVTAKKLRASVIPSGAILWAKIGAALFLNRRRVTARPCCIDNNMTAYIPDGIHISTDWAFHWTSSLDFRRLANPGAVPSLSEGYQSTLPLVVPPVEEQQAIANFLDRETAKIDTLVEKKQQVIELLQEKRTALITHAVTKGLNPDVPMKDTGIEWLGQIPAHWRVLALKRVLRHLIDCEHKTAPAVDESEFRVVRTTAVRSGAYLKDGTYCTSEAGYQEWTRRGAPEPGDVIFTREAPTGEACLVPKGQCVCLGQRTVLMKPRENEYLGGFLVHMIYGGPPRIRIQLASQGSTVGHFNMDDIGWMQILQPPLQEQRRIVDYLDQETAKIDTLITKVKEAIERLKEYRTALISAAVTGKIDVREAVR